MGSPVKETEDPPYAKTMSCATVDSVQVIPKLLPHRRPVVSLWRGANYKVSSTFAEG